MEEYKKDTAVAVQRPVLESALEILDKNIGELNFSLQELENRLAPVMKENETNKGGGAVASADNATSPVVTAVRRKSEYIEELNRRVCSILRRLEV